VVGRLLLHGELRGHRRDQARVVALGEPPHRAAVLVAEGPGPRACRRRARLGVHGRQAEGAADQEVGNDPTGWGQVGSSARSAWTWRKSQGGGMFLEVPAGAEVVVRVNLDARRDGRRVGRIRSRHHGRR
jgi:hypothetical protein